MHKWFDVPVENLIVILLALVVLGFVVTWLIASRSSGNRNKTTIKGNHNTVTNTQIDNSVRQTRINANIHIKVPAHAAPPPPPPPPSRAPDAAEVEFVVWAVITVAVAFAYVRFFGPLSIIGLALCALAIGAAIALFALSLTSKLGDTVATVSRALYLLGTSLASAWFLFDSQQLIDPRLVSAAEATPWDANALKALMGFAWRTSLWKSSLGATGIFFFCMFNAMQGLWFAYRTGSAALLAAKLDDVDYRQYGSMPTWRSLSIMFAFIVALAFLRFFLVPHLLLAH